VVPPLTERELATQRVLEAHVQALAIDVGPRSAEEHWELAAAADYIAEQLTGYGYTLARQGVELGDVVAQNLEVARAGSDLGKETIVVGAHYDSQPGSAGANSNASGVAALLALAEAFAQKNPRRKLSFVAYGSSQPPHFGTPQMGSLVHVKALAAAGESIELMLSLDSLGHYAKSQGSQQALPGVRPALPPVGDFLLLLGTEASQPMAQLLSAEFTAARALKVHVARLDEPTAVGLGSDDWAFRRAGMPALLITDTGQLRAQPAADLPEAIDFERLTRTVGAHEAGLAVLADAGG
jgi:hypothetical protein